MAVPQSMCLPLSVILKDQPFFILNFLARVELHMFWELLVHAWLCIMSSDVMQLLSCHADLSSAVWIFFQ